MDVLGAISTLKFWEYSFKMRFGILESQNRVTKSGYAKCVELWVTNSKNFTELLLLSY